MFKFFSDIQIHLLFASVVSIDVVIVVLVVVVIICFSWTARNQQCKKHFSIAADEHVLCLSILFSLSFRVACLFRCKSPRRNEVAAVGELCFCFSCFSSSRARSRRYWCLPLPPHLLQAISWLLNRIRFGSDGNPWIFIAAEKCLWFFTFFFLVFISFRLAFFCFFFLLYLQTGKGVSLWFRVVSTAFSLIHLLPFQTSFCGTEASKANHSFSSPESLFYVLLHFSSPTSSSSSFYCLYLWRWLWLFPQVKFIFIASIRVHLPTLKNRSINWWCSSLIASLLQSSKIRCFVFFCLIQNFLLE